jgi:spermidine synthase
MSNREEALPSARLLLLVFVSGVSALIYELVWIRALGMWFGTSSAAITTVVASFMGGLAVGSIVLGRLADRHPRPLVLYFKVELGIAVSAFGVSLLVMRGTPLLAALAGLVADAGAAGGVVRGAVLLLVLLVPTTLIGGTLPVLARAEVRGANASGTLGAIYAANTAGAVAGALLPDAIIIPFVGLFAATLVAVLGNLIAAFGASRLAQAAKIVESPSANANDAGGGPSSSSSSSSSSSRASLVLFVVSGFVAMGYELLWSRVLEHLVEGLALSFAVLLAVYLVALAIGARLTTRLADRVAKPIGWGAGFIAAAALLAYAPIVWLGRWNELVAPLTPSRPDLVRPPIATWWWLSLVNALWVELGACLLMGAAFPMLAAAAVRSGSAGRTMGVLYAANTLAGVAGAYVTGFVLLPSLGVERSFALLAFASALSCAVVVIKTRPHRSLAFPVLAAIGIGVVGARLPATHFRNVFIHRTARFVKEGTTTTVAVLERSTFGEVSSLELATPGVSMSDTQFSARRYMALMAHLPLLFAHERKRALLICYGVGNTARAVLSHPEIERFDIVDISPEVLSASPYFAQITGSDPLRDPRVHVIVGDGRAHLVSSPAMYDIITSEPPPPNHAGVVNLYSREYYAAARKRLTPGGMVAQWLPVFQLRAEESLAIVAAMAAELPWVSLYMGFGYHWILIGGAAPPAIDIEASRRSLAALTIAKDLAAIGSPDAEDLLGAELADDRSLREATRSVEPVTDDVPILPYPMRAVQKPVVAPPGLLGDRMLGTLEALEVAPTPELIAAATATQSTVRALPLAYTSPPELRELLFGTALRRALALRPKDEAVLALLDVGAESVDAAQRALARDPKHAAARFELARRAFYEDDWTTTLNHLEGLDPKAVGVPKYWLVRGGAERALGRFDDARRSFTNAAAVTTDNGFRANLELLAAHTSSPWPDDGGPLARPGR